MACVQKVECATRETCVCGVKTEHAERAWHAQESEGLSTWEAGNDRGGKGPWFRVLSRGVDEWEIGESLTTPTKLEEFQEKLYVKAKANCRR